MAELSNSKSLPVVVPLPFRAQASEAFRILRRTFQQPGTRTWPRVVLGALLVVAMTVSGFYGLLKVEVMTWSPAWVAAGVGLVALYDGFAKIVTDSASPDSELDKAALVALRRMRWFAALCAFAFSVGVAARLLPHVVPGALLSACAVLVVSSCWIAAGVTLRGEQQDR